MKTLKKLILPIVGSIVLNSCIGTKSFTGICTEEWNSPHSYFVTSHKKQKIEKDSKLKWGTILYSENDYFNVDDSVKVRYNKKSHEIVSSKILK